MAAPALAQQARQGWSFERYPSYRKGQQLRIDFRARVQTDFRVLSPDYPTDRGLFDLRRLRFSLQGYVLRDFEYEVDLSAKELRTFRDLYVNLRHLRRAQLKAGKFKIPFGLDQLTPPHRIDFASRALISDYIAPARDWGAMLHGRLLRRTIGYEAGYFRGDGENAEDSEDRKTGRNTLAVRLTGTPVRVGPKVFRTVELGLAYTNSSLPASLGSLRGRNVLREPFFPRVYVNGRRTRWGTELLWMPGPFSVKGEFMAARAGRLGQGILENDLPDVLTRGWYLSGSWLLTGEKKQDRIEPARPFLTKGFGAFELAARYEQIRFASDTDAGTPSRSPRATNLLAQSDRVWTYGANWFLNDWSRIQFNAVHETLEDSQRSPIAGRTRFWTFITRLQFVM